MKYTGRNLQAISFPLGGIGTGCVGLTGNGELLDWEIKNRPNKGSFNNFTFFAVKAEKDGALLSERVLNGDLPTPYMGQANTSFGYGPDRQHMCGVPHFRSCEFDGEFPFATISFEDEKFPGKPSLTAFNPMIPSNAEDSGIPAAFFTVKIKNDTKDTLDYTVAGALSNMLVKNTVNKARRLKKGGIIELTGDPSDENDPEFGSMALATDCEDCALQEYGFRGGWFDGLYVFWSDFAKPGHLKPRHYDAPGHYDMCAISAHMRLKPGEEGSVRFIIGWYFPNFYKYWHQFSAFTPATAEEKLKNTWKNYYATRFASASDAITYSLDNWDRLEGDTLKFKQALFASTLPSYAIDAISATMSVLKTPTCIRLTDGTFYGWEGLNAHGGSCEGTCTHVWNYAYALCYLFPELERTIRDSNYKYNQDENGGMRFRMQLPLGSKYNDFRPCVDGQFGDVIKVYREWKICGDSEWLKNLWPAVKKSIEFAWSPQNPDKWDLNKDGVLEGRQHHTLDMELFGPSGWLNGLYLAALKAGSEMAKVCGDDAAAAEYTALFESGSKWVEENLFNGEYYVQKVDIFDKNVLAPFAPAVYDQEENRVYKDYWNDEAGQIKYQITNGCDIDQVLAQWHADNMGLGRIFDKDHTVSALNAIYKYNFVSMRDHFNACRVYSLNDEKGTVMFGWPGQNQMPAIPVPYSTETMYGFEYQAAVCMLQNGLIDKGLELIKAIRDRHTGENRNPWNEMECGSNYSRSMAAYSILTALGGFQIDMTRGFMGFEPKINETAFNTFWAADGAWGSYAQTASQAEFKPLYGALTLSVFKAGKLDAAAVTLNGKPVPFTKTPDAIAFESPVTLNPGDTLLIM